MWVRRHLAFLLASFILLAVPASASADQWFAPTSFWNTPLAPDAPLEPRSDTWVKDLTTKVADYGPWINTTQYSWPVVTVPADQPRVTVKIDWPSATYDSEFLSVPVPPDMRMGAGTDGRAVLHQPSTDTIWEFWQLRKSPLDNMWHANTAGVIKNASTDDGLFNDTLPYEEPYGASATELPIVAGMITPEDIQRGQIDHALSIGVPHPLYKWWWSWPATRSDGDSSDIYAIPEGARLRLPANLDLTQFGLSKTALAIARAAQKYGLVVRDKSDAVVFYAQDIQPDPYPALWGGQWPSKVLAGFPWQLLQVLETQPNYAWPWDPEEPTAPLEEPVETEPEPTPKGKGGGSRKKG